MYYLTTTGIKSSTEHDTALSAWKKSYDDNIPVKYVQTTAVLVKATIREDDDQIVNSKDGLGASPAVKKDMRDLLCSWDRCKIAQDTCLLSDLKATCRDYEKVIEKAKILTEFRKRIDFVQPFSEDLEDTLEGSDEKSKNAFDEAEPYLPSSDTLLTKFMSDTVNGVSEIDGISSWLQLMSCTGICTDRLCPTLV